MDLQTVLWISEVVVIVYLRFWIVLILALDLTIDLVFKVIYITDLMANTIWNWWKWFGEKWQQF